MENDRELDTEEWTYRYSKVATNLSMYPNLCGYMEISKVRLQ